MSSAAELLRGLELLDPASADSDDVERVLRALGEVVSRVRLIEAAWHGRARELFEAGFGADDETLIRRTRRSSSAKAKREAAQSKVLNNDKQVADAFVAGEIGAEYVDLIARAITRVPESMRAEFDRRREALVAYARQYPLDAFARYLDNIVEQLVRDGLDRLERQKAESRARKWRDPLTGMYVMELRFDPETGERIFNSVDAEYAAIKADTSDLSPEQRLALAIANLLLTGCRTARPAPSRQSS